MLDATLRTLRRNTMKTLNDFLQSHPAAPDLKAVVAAVASACVEISRVVSAGAIAGNLGSAGQMNVQAEEQKQLVPWRIISDEKSAESFAAELEINPLRSFGSTSISGAIDFSVKLLKDSGYRTTRKIIDISGERCVDCDRMTGRPLAVARDEAVKAGITVNGLQIFFPSHPGKTVKKNIPDFYQNEVICGPKSFALTARKPEDFTQALISKLSLEIAGILIPRG